MSSPASAQNFDCFTTIDKTWAERCLDGEYDAVWRTYEGKTVQHLRTYDKLGYKVVAFKSLQLHNNKPVEYTKILRICPGGYIAESVFIESRRELIIIAGCGERSRAKFVNAVYLKISEPRPPTSALASR